MAGDVRVPGVVAGAAVAAARAAGGGAALAASQATTIVGGGETAEAVEEFGLADKMTHVSTGGGAFLEYVEGTPFAALAEIDDKA